MNDIHRFRLYVAGTSQHSATALRNLHALCAAHLAGRHQIEVVDILVQPERALRDGVMVTPTLLKLAPPPGMRLTGNLSDTEVVLAGLGLPPTS